MSTPVVTPVIVLISPSSDEDGDDERNLYEEIDATLISSPEDDVDEVRNLDLEQEPESEHDGDYNKSDNHESDVEEDNDVEKSDEEECFDDCDKRRDMVDCFNQDLRTVSPKVIRKKKRGSNDLEELSLYECKTYLRKHGMRVSGTKEECIQRIKEHGRLKDGRGESLYPRSSFSINCTGDACKGDDVFFKQDVCEGGNVMGRRSIAGRIVKESYGASKQQHTFSVEVLWSKRSNKLNPLSILLVKGRNLYRFGTFRQPWKNEAERSEVLREKHSRGDAARHKKKLRQTEFASNKNKSAKRQKVSHTGPSQTKQPTHTDKQELTLLNSHPDPRLDPNINAKPDPNINEAERSEVLREKHSRGDAARHKKKLRQTEFASNNNKSAKRQKVSHTGPSQTKQPTHTDKQELTLLNSHPDPSPDPNINAKPDPTPNANPDHHQQEASSSIPYDRTLFPNQLSLGFPGNGHHNEQQGPDRVFNQPPGHHHCNYEPITRLKDGAVRSLFPKSSFSINCTGNACKGDVVLFKQHVYKKGNIVGKRRSVAGRIIKERFRARKHRFTIEVLWTKKNIKLPPLSTLVVRGHDLYRFGTFRQPWKNEAERSEVVGKKQRQTGACRGERKLRKTKIAFNNDKGVRHQQVTCRGPSQSKQKFAKRWGAGPVTRSQTAHKRKAFRFQIKKSEKSKQLTTQIDKQTFRPDPNPYPDPTQIDKQKSAKRLVASPSTTPHKMESVWFQKMEYNNSTQQTFHPNPDPNPNLNPNPNPNPGINPSPDCYRYFNHHFQQASFFSTNLLHNHVSPWSLGYGHYNNGQWGPNNGFYQPPSYSHYNYQQPGPRYWFG